MGRYRSLSMVVLLVLAFITSAACADVISLEFVTVGNPGNQPDTRYDETGFGAVDYVYAIGKYEVTTGQYTAFLNAVAKTDTYGLYSTNMRSEEWGCKIQRDGSSGNYTYSVADDRVNRPVNNVSWGDAARFMNWLHNGQPTGDQGADTTETGAYTLNGATSDSALMAITRNAVAKYWIPSENEWHKAAYHKNDGVTGNYWDYPMGSDTMPSNKLTPDVGNNANFHDRDYTIGSPYWMTEVGAFMNSKSPYGTFDQGGNLWEWNETALRDSSRGLRGGALDALNIDLHAFYRNDRPPTREYNTTGFRVATVPEPSSITLMLCASALAGLLWWRRRK